MLFCLQTRRSTQLICRKTTFLVLNCPLILRIWLCTSMAVVMAQLRGSPPWPNENPCHFHNSCSQLRELFNEGSGKRNSLHGFKHQRLQGMLSLFCTVNCNNTTLVKTWKKPRHDYKGTLTPDINSTAIYKTSRRECKENPSLEAEGISEVAEHSSIGIDSSSYVYLLQEITKKRALTEGKQVHAHVLKSGHTCDGWVGNKLVVMYIKCGSLEDARRVFDKMSQRNASLWSILIGAYARCRLWEDVFKLLNWMQGLGLRADNIIVPSVLKACAGLTALEKGKEVHGYIIRNEFELDIVVENALVDMYAKCGFVEYARQVFDKMSQKDVVSWTAIIGGYAQIGVSEEALRLHGEMELSGVNSDVITWNAMMAGFAQNGKGDEALKLLNRMQLSGLKPDVNSWNAIVTGCTQNGYAEEALEAFYQMLLAGVKPNSVTISGVVSACADLGTPWQGIQIHGYVIKSGFQSNVFAGSALIDMYSKCLNIDYARKVFDQVPEKNAVLWNTMISGYAYNGHTDQALELFHEMNLTGMTPDAITWNAIITSHAKKGQGYKALELLFEMHLADLKPNAISWNSLIAGSVQSGNDEEALKLFHQMQLGSVTLDLGSWNGVITRCSQDGHNEETVKQFRQMKMAPIKPNPVTIASILSVCARLMALQHGKEVHCYILRNGFESNVFVGSSLVDMYAKCKSVEAARKIFDMLPQRNVVSWNVMIAAYAQRRHTDDALKLFHQMEDASLKPDLATITPVLPVFSNLMLLQEGKQVHSYLIRHAMDSDVFVRSALIDMYAKCGRIEDSRRVFDQTYERDVAVWNAMIAGYATHGLSEDGLTIFHQMQWSGVKPDHITFTTVLSACSRSGMVSEGCQYFNSMPKDYGIKPSIEHYTCIANLLGFAGNLDDAHKLISNMPFEPDACIWGVLLHACRLHSNVELGEYAAKQLFELEPENVGNYVLLSNIYAAVGRWGDVGKIRDMIKDRAVKIRSECSWIKVNKSVHAFLVGDNSHPELEKISAKFDDLAMQMEEEGFVPEIHLKFSQNNFDGEDYIFCGHTEKLAVVFGLLNTPSQTPIRVIKNLRMCVDCHTTAKIISRITEKEIHVRDTCRFHYFKDGACSCRDSW
ncbi:putative pentatricopeptide repeat-containing protein At3g23330 [Cryptomeria japonica]|uniref:putative pentatricopeptide repeat-containing protein At3g23330 n=1 Tax=Cryptomeria japonica TaxID=3369 RepID=UPI0027DA8A51|nr:putative pentatricopeptide repeat-containing protein At3g23330 [Cryptomeria japonica]